MVPMPESFNVYKILQVDPEASPEVIEAAYRTLAEINHPDRNPAADTGELMAEINRAYRLLSDPQRRAIYDLRHLRTSIGDIVPDVISAKSFRLVNDLGQTRAELSLDQAGEPRLAMNDRDGECWFDMYHDENGSRLLFNDQDKDVRLVLGVTDYGDPYLVMFCRGAELRAELQLGMSDVHPHLEFHNHSGVVRLGVVEKDDGTPTLEINEESRAR